MILRQLSKLYNFCQLPQHTKWFLLLGVVSCLGAPIPNASAQDAGSFQNAAAYRQALQRPAARGFYRPSNAGAVSRAIVAQRRALIRELREQKIGKLPSAKGQGLRRMQDNDGVIVLTNHGQAAPARQQTSTVRLPAEPVQERQLDLRRVMEQSSVVAPLQPFDPATGREAVAPNADDTGLDIALAALVALGLGLLGLSAWQRSQLP